MYEQNILKLHKLKDLFNKHEKYFIKMEFNSVNFLNAEIAIIDTQHLKISAAFTINFSENYAVDFFIKKIKEKYFDLKVKEIDIPIFTHDSGNINI